MNAWTRQEKSAMECGEDIRIKRNIETGGDDKVENGYDNEANKVNVGATGHE